MRFVLTGATGFLGTEVAKSLTAHGQEVCLLVRPDSNAAALAALDVHKVITYSSLLAPPVQLQLAKWQPEVMIHMAWKGVAGKQRNDAAHFTENIPFTLAAVELAYKSGCRHWVGIGSQAEYGIPNMQVKEDAPCFPVTAYGKAKLAAGIAAVGLCDQLQMSSTWCRVFSVYGPGDHADSFVSYLIHAMDRGEAPSLTRCEQRWDYLFISDAANAIHKLAEKHCEGTFNLGSGKARVLREVVEMIKDKAEYNGTIGYGAKPYATQQIMHLQADVTKLIERTGWTPQIDLEEGLEKTIHFRKKLKHESV